MKTTRSLFVLVAVIALLLAACGSPAPAPEPTAAIEQPTVVEPTAPPPPTTAPAEPSPLQPTQPQYAPLCQSAPTGCQAPVVTVLDPKYCVEKVPYVIMSVPAGATYEPLDPDMKCDKQLHNDGNLRVTCHSITNKELVSYDLKVCNGACSAPALQMGTGQCLEGYGYDATNTCCAAPAPAGAEGCTTYKVDIRTCPDPQ